MYNLYIPFCALVLNIVLLLLYKYKVNNVVNENRPYFMMIVDSFTMSIFCMIALYSVYAGADDIIVKIANKIECCAVFNYFANLLAYILHTVNLRNKKTIIAYYIINFVMFIVMFLLPVSYEVAPDLSYMVSTGLLINVAMASSGIMLLLTLIISLNKRKVLKGKIVPVIVLIGFIVLIVVVRYLKPEFVCIEYLATIAVLIMFHTIENPDMKMIEELNIAKQQAEKSNRAKTDFLSSMSHEIRTPLNAIVGFNECITEAKTIEEARENAKDVITATNVLLETINGILDISKIESGKLEIIKARYKPKKLFEDAAKLLEARMMEKNLEFVVHITDHLPYKLMGDQANLKKCVLNLLTNAVKYTDTGSVIFNVDCENDDNNCKLIISVEDTGKGIKTESISDIFNKFQRLEEDKNGAIEGTGLGLAITKQLVELMGGKIVVQSRYGEGSKFTIYLTQEIIQKEPSVENEVIDTPVVQNTLTFNNNEKILVVDDNPLNIKVASKLLEKYNLKVDTAASGDECLGLVKTNKYDLIFMDEMMPVKSGIETLKELKSDPSFDIPVIALTADALVGQREKYLKEGFLEYLPKPINKLELERCLRHFLINNKRRPLSFDDTEAYILDFKEKNEKEN